MPVPARAPWLLRVNFSAYRTCIIRLTYGCAWHRFGVSICHLILLPILVLDPRQAFALLPWTSGGVLRGEKA